MSLNFLATRFQCSWPWSTLVMLCDGRIVCGCADPYGHRVLGDVRGGSIHDVWSGGVMSQLRADLNAGGSTFCGDCPLKLPLKKDDQPAVRAIDAGPLPSRMYIECTAACNISCAEACCAPETGITRTRQAGMLDFDLFRRIVDEAGPSLVRIDFFNYGEAFLHKRAVEMCEYIKTNFAHVHPYTSTNGLALSAAPAPAAAGPDARAQPLHAPLPRAGQLRPPARASWRAAVRRQRSGDQSRFRARLAPRHARSRRHDGRPD